jgi:hypothetical protein
VLLAVVLHRHGLWAVLGKQSMCHPSHSCPFRVAPLPTKILETLSCKADVLDDDDDFGKLIFQSLSKVKEDIQNKEGSADRAAERCIRILNAAVGQQIDVPGS